MSRLYKSYNPLKKQLYIITAKLSGIWMTAFILIIALEFFEVLPYFGFFVLSFVSLFSAFLGKRLQVTMSGLKGEKIITDAAKHLPDGYTAFANVTLHFNEKESETDLIVVGKKGVFIIEVKNHNGSITGRVEDRNWKQFKVTKNGGRYVNEFYNPTKQVKTHVFRLSEILKDKGFHGWIQGVVVFSNIETVVNVRERDIPVLSKGKGVDAVLDNFVPKKSLSEDEVGLISDAIKEQIINSRLRSKRNEK